MMFLIQLSPGSNEASGPWNGTAGNVTQNKPFLHVLRVKYSVRAMKVTTIAKVAGGS